MAGPVKNEYSSFEFIQPADYTKAFDARAKEMLESWETAEKVMQRNNAQRTASAKSFGKAIESVQKLTPTLAKTWKDQRDKADIQHRNNGRILYRDLIEEGHPATARDLVEYNQNDANHNKDTGYYDTVAAKLEAEGKLELAERVRNLTGRRGKIFKQVLAMKAANGMYDNFHATVDQVQLDDGTTWASATETGQKEAIIAKWQTEHGLNVDDIGGLNDEFLDTYYFKKTEEQKYKILSESAEDAKAANLAEFESAEKETLLEAVKQGNGLGGKAVIDFITANPRKFGSKYAAKVKAREWLLKMYSDGQITRQQLLSIGDYKSVGKHDGKEFSVFSWKEFDQEGEFGALLDQATRERSRLDLQNREAIRVKAGEDALRFQKEELGGRRYTENEIADLINNFKREHPGIKVPDQYTQLANDTQEDRADTQIVRDLEARRRAGLPIRPEHYRGLTDATLLKQWQEYGDSPAGQGVNKRMINFRNQTFEGATAKIMNETLGATVKTPNYRMTILSAEARLQTLFENEVVNAPDPDALYEQLVKQVSDEILNGDHGEGGAYRKKTDDVTAFTIKKQTAVDYIKAMDNEGSLGIELIPGTEKDIQRLEAYVKNPAVYNIPPIYSHIASHLKKFDVGHPLEGQLVTPYYIANLQYRAATGKELPRPSVQDRLESKKSIVQRWLNWKNNGRKTKRAIIVEEDGNVNAPENTIFGGALA